MSKEDVIALMKSSSSEKAWNNNCDTVKKEFNGYPEWWFAEIVMSGILRETSASWSK